MASRLSATHPSWPQMSYNPSPEAENGQPAVCPPPLLATNEHYNLAGALDTFLQQAGDQLAGAGFIAKPLEMENQRLNTGGEPGLGVVLEYTYTGRLAISETSWIRIRREGTDPDYNVTGNRQKLKFRKLIILGRI